MFLMSSMSSRGIFLKLYSGRSNLITMLLFSIHEQLQFTIEKRQKLLTKFLIYVLKN